MAAATFTFDSLGGSPFIKVYAGPGDDEAGHQRTGGYRDGDQVPALCVASGRPVVSDPSAGEAARHSDL